MELNRTWTVESGLSSAPMSHAVESGRESPSTSSEKLVCVIPTSMASEPSLRCRSTVPVSDTNRFEGNRFTRFPAPPKEPAVASPDKLLLNVENAPPVWTTKASSTLPTEITFSTVLPMLVSVA
jgi:hypothetical protein